ncbi:FAD-dependent monooxygenase [Streptomyces sp. H27-G5]|uniref:NAD(P)-binding protein n=1 Tax=Streptomyces sp. H27-G5 TaxID=2996698 RepID=UPI00226EC3C7|nr:NAD(P)-binding protein [Streptomyces sp. H27-G5]MCY0921975.1 FAD-dependent monooxygenase [Streptomyces sp. H27-G5]
MPRPDSTGPDYDVVISGAALAGSAAAILLARRGARVALLERRSDPDGVQGAVYPLLDGQRLPGTR